MYTCQICKKSLSRSDNLSRHIKLKHAMGMTGGGIYEEKRDAVMRGEIDNIFEGSDSETSSQKDDSSEKEFYESDSDNSEDSDTAEDSKDASDSNDLPTIKSVIQGLGKRKTHVFYEVLKDYEDETHPEKKANKYMLKHNREKFLDLYIIFMKKVVGLNRSKVHREILRKIRKYRKQGISGNEAIRKAIMNRQYAFEKYFLEYDAEEEEELQ